MNRRTASRFLLAAAMLALTGLVVLAGCKKRANEIRIGAILPLTGENASYGLALRNGLQVGLDEINRNVSGTSSRIAVVFEDDQAEPQTGVSAFKKLVAVDRVPMVIGAMFSAVTLAIAPIAESQGVVLLSPTSSTVDLTMAGDYIFRIYPSDTYDGTFLAQVCSEKFRATKVGIVFLQVASTTAISDVFTQEFVRHGGSIVFREGYSEGETDFRSILSKVQQLKPGIVFIPGYLREMATLLRQAREMHVSTQFVSISTFDDPRILQLAGDAAEGVVFSSPAYDPDLPDTLVQRFVASYREKYRETPNIWAGYGYDVIRVAAHAIANSDRTATGIKKALYATQGFPGVTGAVSFDENGDVTKTLRLMQVRNGRFERLK